MECLEKKKYWIWFSLIKGLGCVRKNKLLQLYCKLKSVLKTFTFCVIILMKIKRM